MESNEQKQLERITLKTADRESDTYTYWNDSTVFQYQKVLENSVEGERQTIGTRDKQVSEQQQTNTQSKPPDVWFVGITIIILSVIGYGIIRFRKT